MGSIGDDIYDDQAGDFSEVYLPKWDSYVIEAEFWFSLVKIFW